MDILEKSLSRGYSILDKIFVSLQSTLSEESYNNVLLVIKPVFTISLILIPIYIVYSLLHFFYFLLTKRRLKIKVLISVIIAFVFFVVIYITYKYLFSGEAITQ